GHCHSSVELLARNTVSRDPAELLLDRRAHGRDEHRRAAYSCRLRFPLRGYRRRDLGVDSKESKVGLCCWWVTDRTRSIIPGGVSKLPCIFKRTLGWTIADVQVLD